MKRLTGSDSEIRYVPYEQVYGPGFDDMQRRLPSLERIERMVGYKCKTSIDTILERVIDYYRKELATSEEPMQDGAPANRVQ